MARDLFPPALASSLYVRLDATNDTQTFGPGKYLLDTSGAAFGVQLTYQAGTEWEFKDIAAASSSNVSIGLVTDQFNVGGAVGVQPGPFIIDTDHVVAEIVADPVTANLYHVHIHSGFLIVLLRWSSTAFRFDSTAITFDQTRI